MKFSRQFVYHIAELAHLPLNDEQAETLQREFDESMQVVDELTKIDTQNVAPTYQVGNLSNVLRDDVVDEKHMLSQEAALSGATRTHEGYFVVERVIDHEA